MSESKEKLNEYLRNATWQFAKSMPTMPHEYTLRHTAEDQQGFNGAVRAIRQHGQKERFYRQRFIYYYMDGYKFWTMGDPVKDTILINRAIVENPVRWDKAAKLYDTAFNDSESLSIDREVMRMIPTQGHVLDVGAGTGLFLDYKQDEVPPDRYTAIEPSQGMVNMFRKKHPEYTVIVSAFEHWCRQAVLKQYDSVLALFGVPNYINPGEWKRFREVCSPDGQMFLMFYDEQYDPEVNRRTGIALPYYSTDWRGWRPSTRIRWGNYILGR